MRFTSRNSSEKGTSRPFSEQWLTEPPDQAPPPERRGSSLPSWLPGEGVLAALAVLLLILVALPWRHSSDVERDPNQNIVPAAAAMAETPASDDARPTQIPTATGVAVAEAPSDSEPTQEAEPTDVPDPTATTASQPTPGPRPEGAIVPDSRIVSYYGFPGEPNMGILGEYLMADLLLLLQEQGAVYEAVDPSKPVQLAFEIIGSIAQPWATDDGDWLHYIGEDLLQQYVDFTAENNLLLIIDVQFGTNGIEEEIAWARKWLAYPHVHLAIDPEFAVEEGQVPGQVIGSITAEDVMYAQRELATISQDFGIPPKLLILHQFTRGSVTDRETITPVDGVQFIIEVDGFGPPADKRATFDYILQDSPTDLVGFKLWYKQDIPLMTEQEVVDLSPSPILVIYQ